MSKEIQDSQVRQIRKAIHKVVEVGPDFLAKKISADQMAHTMIQAVDEYVKEAGSEHLKPQSEEAQELMSVLAELRGCGSGFLANRCDAACVARTITYMVDEFKA